MANARFAREQKNFSFRWNVSRCETSACWCKPTARSASGSTSVQAAASRTCGAGFPACRLRGILASRPRSGSSI